jgi:hypothetical protein
VRSLSIGGWARVCATAFCLALPASAVSGDRAHAADALEERKLAMKFNWYAPKTGACAADCGGWISAVGVVTSDTPKLFDDFADAHDIKDIKGATIVLDSSGGSVLDAIAVGRRWRELGLTTTVGIVIDRQVASGGSERFSSPDAYCESMCVFLLLSGKSRLVPDGAHVRVHQIWMGDRADDAKAASYNADDVTIIERDIGRLAKYTFDMGGSGDLLLLALSVPPWEQLHELSRAELEATNVVTAPSGEVASADRATRQAAGTKPVQDRFMSANTEGETAVVVMTPTKTADAEKPTGGYSAGADHR